MRDIRFERERFDKALKFYGKHKVVPQTANVRIEVEIKAGKGQYRFDLKKDASVARATEQVLRRNDLFIAKSIGVALMVEETAKPGHAPLLTYPLLQSDALPVGVKGLTNKDAEVIYNGSLSMKTGAVVNYSRFPLNKFRIVPETQPVVMLDSGDAVVSSGLVPQYDHEKLMQMLPEELVLAGTKDQPIDIIFPSDENTVIEGEAGTKVYLVLMFDGWLLEGATNEEFKVTENPYAGNI